MSAARSPFPGSHVLTKSPGQTISCFWTAQNSGNAVGHAALVLFNETMSAATPVKVGAVGAVQPGSTRSLDVLVFLEEGVNIVNGVNSLTLEMQLVEENKAFPFHTFTVNFSGAFSSSLVMLSHTILAIAQDKFEWRVLVNNFTANTAFWQPVRTEMTDINPSEFTRRQTTRTAAPFSDSSFLATTDTLASHIFGQVWVDEVTSSGVLLGEVPGSRFAYDIVLA